MLPRRGENGALTNLHGELTAAKRHQLGEKKKRHPITPTPSPVAAAATTSPECTMTGLSGGSVTVAVGQTLCVTAPGSWTGTRLVNVNLVVCGSGDFSITGTGLVYGWYYRTPTTEVKVNDGGITVL